MSDTEQAAPAPRFGLRSWAFVALMLALTALFAWLGQWQLHRLAEKEALIAAVEERENSTPIALPPVAEWAHLDPEVYSYRPVSVSGTLDTDRTILVFTSLSKPRGKFSGPGFWVMTPMTVTTGGTVFINRGFVPQAASQAFLTDDATPPGPQTLTGMALLPEKADSFTPGPDRIKRIDWIRDPERLEGMLEPDGQPVAGFFIDAPAGEEGALPQGGETVVEFPNNHLGYAFTWFGFALITPLLLIAWVWRQLRPAKNIAA